jgi:hypothetical protein
VLQCDRVGQRGRRQGKADPSRCGARDDGAEAKATGSSHMKKERRMKDSSLRFAAFGMTVGC